MAERKQEPKCSECGGGMVCPESIEIGRCLWCRPWRVDEGRAVKASTTLFLKGEGDGG